MSEPTPAPALKEMFNAARYKSTAKDLGEIYPGFDSKAFLKFTLEGLDDLNLMQRLRRMTEGLHATLPTNFSKALPVLYKLAPRIDRGFITLFLSDYVAMYGEEHFEESMEALKYFTPFGSAEFAIRHFLKSDLKKTLKVMKQWSKDPDEHVRRLASEGSRPRLPWSFKLEPIIKDPELTAPILENLKADPSLYVRKSVANHLNDFTKDSPDWVLNRIQDWSLENAHTLWIVRHALRTLIKKGDRRALTVLGAGEKAAVKVDNLTLSPVDVTLGDSLTMTFDIASTAATSQKLVIDYVIHYVKKSGSTSPKVFKLKELLLAPHEKLRIKKSQSIRDFTTRKHHAGRHAVEVMINGDIFASSTFNLRFRSNKRRNPTLESLAV